MSKYLTSRGPLERITHVHTELERGRFPNCRKLAEALETSCKTIQRDIDFMRYRLNLPIAYDAKRFGFYYESPASRAEREAASSRSTAKGFTFSPAAEALLKRVSRPKPFPWLGRALM